MKLSFLVLLLFPFTLFAENLQSIQTNTKTVENELSNNQFITTINTKQETGKKIYERYCINCHQDGVADAPRFRHVEDWTPRLSNKKLKHLVESAMKGLNMMPPQGTCIECNNEDLKAAIQYMLPKNHD